MASQDTRAATTMVFEARKLFSLPSEKAPKRKQSPQIELKKQLEGKPRCQRRSLKAVLKSSWTVFCCRCHTPYDCKHGVFNEWALKNLQLHQK